MKKVTEYSNNAPYQTKLSRRDSLKWLGALSATAMLPTIAGCDSPEAITSNVSEALSEVSKGHWPTLKLSPITATGYGKDPNLIIPPKSPWPKTLTVEQLTLVAVISDILVPREGDVPSATEVHVPDVIDEWVSAPYEGQQGDREKILACLQWLDDEAQLRYQQGFTAVSKDKQLAIIDDIAYQQADLAEEYLRASDVFSRFRKLVLAAFFCSPEGSKDLGYMGNVAISGDYPGPTKAAMKHLNQALDKLGLSLSL